MRTSFGNLQTYGRILALVFGSYGEWSKDVNSLMDLCIKRIAENNWVTDGYHSKSDMKSVLASSLKSHLGQISLRLVAQLIHSRMRAIGCDINKTKKTENDLLSNFDEQRDHRTEQLSIDRHNNEVNTFRNNHFHLA